jgi:hypothetical protein
LFEQLPEEITLAEPAMTRLGEGRMVGDLIFNPKLAEPAIGKVQMRLFTQAPFRANAKTITHKQHPAHQLRINRRPASVTVEWLQVRAQIIKVEEANS